MAALAGAAIAMAPAAPATAQSADNVIDIVSPPNPHVFPLLVAMADHPDLPVRLHPVASGKDIAPQFANGAEALLAMTYVGAKQRSSGAVTDLELVLPVTWRGFWEVAPAGIESFSDLKGKTVVVSGPVGTGKGGGGDIIFRAAALRQGINPDTDLNVVYAPVSDAQKLLQSGEASGIAVPSPASTGFAMMGRMNGSGLGKAIDYQAIFSGYGSFPTGQLPLGGIHATASTLADPAKRANLKRVIDAYAQAVIELEREPLRYSRVAADQFAKYYSGTGAPNPPAPVIAASLMNGDLVYRTDIGNEVIKRDLTAWLTELLGSAPDPRFFATGNFAVAKAPVVGGKPTTPRKMRMRPMRRN